MLLRTAVTTRHRASGDHPYRWGLLVALGGLTGWIVFLAIGEARQELLLIAIALVLALGLDPVVMRLTRRGMSRGWAVATVALTGLALVVSFLAWMVPTLVDQAEAFTRQFPAYQRQLQDHSNVLGRLNAKYHVLDSIRSKVSQGGSGSIVGGVFGAGKIAVSAAAAAVLLIVLTLYFLAGLPQLKQLCRRLAPAPHRDRASELTDEVCKRVGGYVLGNALTSLIAGAGTLVWALAFGLPDAVLLAVIVAVLDLVPVVGSTVGGTFAALLGLTVSVPVGIATAGFYIAYRVLEDYLIVPRVMGRTVQVDGLLTVVALMIGGAVLGIVGALLAIPVAATVKLLLDEVLFPELDRAGSPGEDVAVVPVGLVPAEPVAVGHRKQSLTRRLAGPAGLFGIGVLTGRRRKN
ncbi:MAG TPA: AI-2E family transporter [Sporichthyaceae bacterium]|jgi:predicted PurR-regulated permease PerM|nr:AI-2E family transporter [Sporichthyaceae bacterium]